jgi:hypothetical protein
MKYLLTGIFELLDKEKSSKKFEKVGRLARNLGG